MKKVFLWAMVFSKCQQSNIHNFLWVDDILIASKTKADLMKIKAKLNSRFKMTDLGKLSWFLGIQFECKNTTIKMDQSRYIKQILSKFYMRDCKLHSIPCEMDINKISDEVDLIDNKLYWEIIGCLIWGALNKFQDFFSYGHFYW